MKNTPPPSRPSGRLRRGFTLIEVMVALTVMVTVISFIYQVLENSVRGQRMIREGLRTPKVQNTILGQIFRDFRYIYWDGLSGQAGFIGRDGSAGGKEADSVDFVVARPSRVAHTDDDAARDQIPSPLTEVGYALRQNDRNSDYLELWRREDWFIDDNPTGGGKYTLIHDKITTFQLSYFPIPELNVNNEGSDEWDSRVKKSLPYAIVLDISFDVEEPVGGTTHENQEHVRRIIMLKPAYNVRHVEAPAAPR